MDRFLTRVHDCSLVTAVVATWTLSVTEVPSALFAIGILILLMSFLNLRNGLPESAIPRDEWSQYRKVEHVVLSGLETGALWSMGLAVVKWILRAIFF